MRRWRPLPRLGVMLFGQLVLWLVFWSYVSFPWSVRSPLRDPSNYSSIWWSYRRRRRRRWWNPATAWETWWRLCAGAPLGLASESVNASWEAQRVKATLGWPTKPLAHRLLFYWTQRRGNLLQLDPSGASSAVAVVELFSVDPDLNRRAFARVFK